MDRQQEARSKIARHLGGIISRIFKVLQAHIGQDFTITVICRNNNVPPGGQGHMIFSQDDEALALAALAAMQDYKGERYLLNNDTSEIVSRH